MRDRDPLEDWQMCGWLIRADEETQQAQQRQAIQALDNLAALLASKPPSGGKKEQLGGITLSQWSTVALPPEQRRRAEELYPALVERGGMGSTHVQAGLLTLVAFGLSEESLPFWARVLDYNRPRDTFAVQRRRFALAALAFLAIRGNSSAAFSALSAAARHPLDSVRGLAVLYLAAAYQTTDQPLPAEVVAQLSEIAIYDKAFEARFFARAALRAAELPVPCDNPAGTYAFKVKLKYDKDFHCVIELLSKQTLEDLHLAIQSAYKWDNDHLYAFYLNGEKYDQRFEFGVSDDSPCYTHEGVIGELGLVVGHKFLYYFDFGDSHEFEVKVTGTTAKASAEKYPRVVESKGKAPKQYHWGDWDGEDDEDDDDDEE